ncbi:WEB family protein [Trema orientale]|uniref:WEB family protein n=1 Tax=Trema orientale TaxID=63057 RepID=A0A2P5EEF6_TREOI|nr:WEB family protein [Trema orientale]
METLKPITPDFHSSVDTSRPFRSVKEAVAIFGERILVGEIYSPNHPSSTTAATSTTPSPHNNNNNNNVNNITKLDRKYSTSDHHGQNILDALKKVEAELEETRAELKLLKEREQETEVAVASLNAELHKNMSKLAEAEAAKAAKAAAAGGTVESRGIISSSHNNGDNYKQQEERIIRRELVRRMEKNPTLAQILSLGEKDLLYSRGRKRERKIIKRKPIVPLVGDLFSRKK